MSQQAVDTRSSTKRGNEWKQGDKESWPNQRSNLSLGVAVAESGWREALSGALRMIESARFPKGVDTPGIDDDNLARCMNVATSAPFLFVGVEAWKRGLRPLGIALGTAAGASALFHGSKKGQGRALFRKCDYYAVTGATVAGSAAFAGRMRKVRAWLALTIAVSCIDPRPAIAFHGLLALGGGVKASLAAASMRPFAALCVALMAVGGWLWCQEPECPRRRGLLHAGWHLAASAASFSLLPVAASLWT